MRTKQRGRKKKKKMEMNREGDYYGDGIISHGRN